MTCQPRTAGSTALTERMRLDQKGNVVIGTGALATGAANGFFYILTANGQPTGVPVSFTGRAPLVVDAANKKLWVFIGSAWRGVALA